MEPPWEKKTKVNINGQGPMTKMLDMPRYGKNVYGAESNIILKLGMHRLGLEVYKVYINEDPEMTLTYFTPRSNLTTFAFDKENCYKVI